MDWKANILIDEDGQARLTCFGLAVIAQKKFWTSLLQDSSINAITWPAPEILRGGPVTKEGDIFTFAVVAIEVRTRRVSCRSLLTYPPFEKAYTGRAPFPSELIIAMGHITVGKRPGRPATLDYDVLWEIIELCWDKEPGKRPTTSQLLETFRAL